MKKFYLAIIALVFTTVAINAQSFTKGDISINVGAGYGPILTPKGVTAERQIPTLSLSLDYGIVKFGKTSIGVGIYGGFSKENLVSVTIPGGAYNHNVDAKLLPPGHPAVTLPYSYATTEHMFPKHTSYSYSTVGAKISINYQVIDNLDLYAGAMLGYCFATPGSNNKDYGKVALEAKHSLPQGTPEHVVGMAIGATPQISAGISAGAQGKLDKDLVPKITKKGGAFAPILFVGARYYITNSVAIFAEGGYGMTNAQAGLSFKF